MSKQQPLLITGIPRSGKSLLRRILVKTGKFRCIHEPFSNYRGAEHKSSIIKNLKHTFTHIDKSNSNCYREDILRLLDYQTYIARVAVDGGITPKKLASLLGRALLGIKCQHRIPLIDDPFLAFSAHWLKAELGWNIIYTTRNPFDFVAERKQRLHGFNITHLANQSSLLNTTLSPWADEIIKESKTNQALVVQNAYLWKYIHEGMIEACTKEPGISIFHFEKMNSPEFMHFESLINSLYNIKPKVNDNIFDFDHINPSDMLTSSEKNTVSEITKKTSLRLLHLENQNQSPSK